MSKAETLAALLFLFLGIAATWPLGLSLGEAIPYGYQVPPGFERIGIFPGDAIDTFYKLWITGEQVTGRVPLLTDPYQFQGPGINPPFIPQDFPFSLLWVVFSPLGAVAAYNLCLLATFVLSGLATRWWLRIEGAGETGALVGAAVFTLLPFRLAQLKGGHFNAFVIFLLPLAAAGTALLASRRRPLLGGLVLGTSLLMLAMMEFHLFYYASLVLAVLLPLRILGGERLRGRFLVTVLHLLIPGILTGIALARWSGRAPSLGSAVGGALLAAAAALALPLLFPADSLSAVRWRGRLAAASLALSPWYLLTAVVAAGFHPRHAFYWAAAAWSFLFAAPPLARQLRRIPRRVLAGLAVAGFLAALGLGYLLWIRHRAVAGSVAGEGRSYQEVSLYTPQPWDLMNRANPNSERFVYPGLAALLLALAAGIGTPGRRAAWTGAVLLGWLSLGPSGDGVLPLYRLAYETIPGFNLPRVPGRIFPLAMLAVSALAAFGADRIAGAGRRFRAAVILTAVCLDFAPSFSTALSILPKTDPVMAAAAATLAPGEKVLHLPLWPGDSANTTLYLYRGVILHRVPMLNGYSPLVLPAFRGGIFPELAPLNLGQDSGEIHHRLRDLRVRYLVIHRKFFPPKVSVFPPSFTVDSLLDSGGFKTASEDGDRILLNVVDVHGPGRATPLPNVGSAAEAESLPRTTGDDVADAAASGGKYRVARTPGYLCFGGWRWYPRGEYQARFFVRATGDVMGEVDAVMESGKTVLGREPFPRDTGGEWKEITMPFSVPRAGTVEFRVRFDGGRDAAVDWLSAGPVGTVPTGTWEAEDFFTFGYPVRVQNASGGAGIAGGELEPAGPLVWGPDLPLPPGSYRAEVMLLPSGAPPGSSPRPEARVTVGEPERPASLGTSGAVSEAGVVSVRFKVERVRPVRVTVERLAGQVLVDSVSITREEP